MVWAHGGGQVSGSGANELYDGTHFAREGVVLVTATGVLEQRVSCIWRN